MGFRVSPRCSAALYLTKSEVWRSLTGSLRGHECRVTQNIPLSVFTEPYVMDRLVLLTAEVWFLFSISMTAGFHLCTSIRHLHIIFLKQKWEEQWLAFEGLFCPDNKTTGPCLYRRLTSTSCINNFTPYFSNIFVL